MAKKTETITHYVDDLDGTSYDEGKGETVKFALDNASFEIDLNEKNAKEFRKFFAPYVQKARVAGRSTTSRSTGTSSNKEELARIRTWAKEKGIAVSDRGRVSADVKAAYSAANK
ncbi:Lsr2 family protein [Cryobacterium sp. TMT2-15-1]|uniref:histone-like nucleoid-structuring protein Lsr2 n=1 Tax=Cryobacterium sp. TMT2-15-1 TaxID=1259246 RepID=UPI00106A780D|nr:Lsr2 family protein [Cryobacterium sp. TMT2-15-1]TFC63700.1 Lsr2 family protein [Cryobacterium sp. TMT2-15-1]